MMGGQEKAGEQDAGLTSMKGERGGGGSGRESLRPTGALQKASPQRTQGLSEASGEPHGLGLQAGQILEAWQL